MLMKHYDLNEQRMDAELKFGAPGLEKVELQEAGTIFTGNFRSDKRCKFG